MVFSLSSKSSFSSLQKITLTSTENVEEEAEGGEVYNYNVYVVKIQVACKAFQEAVDPALVDLFELHCDVYVAFAFNVPTLYRRAEHDSVHYTVLTGNRADLFRKQRGREGFPSRVTNPPDYLSRSPWSMRAEDGRACYRFLPKPAERVELLCA